MRFVKMSRLNSLSLRILLAYVYGMALSIALLALASVFVLKSDVLARMDLSDLAESMAARVRFDGNGRPVELDVDEDGLGWVFDTLRQETAYRVVDEIGGVVFLSSAGAAFWPTGDGAPRPERGRFGFERDGAAMYGATEPVQHDGRTWYFQIAASSRLMTLLHRVALPLVGAGVVLFSLVLLVAFGLSAYITLRHNLKPLRQASDSAAAISPRSIHARLSTRDVPSEIAPLVDSFNRALERLEQGYRVQKEFLGNAAHELKTPLALIRAQIELSERDPNVSDALLSDVEYMTRQVQQLLLLAEASEVHNYTFASVRVRDLADEVVSYLRRMAEAADVPVTVSSAVEGVAWTADRGAMFSLLKNLLENAIQHSPPRTPVSLVVGADTVSVRDMGTGVEESQLPLLFERFWRAPHRRDHGAGLGLAICQEIALAHGWQLFAERAGPGLCFRLVNNAAGTEPAPTASL